jgi:hypothetical protein
MEKTHTVAIRNRLVYTVIKPRRAPTKGWSVAIWFYKAAIGGRGLVAAKGRVYRVSKKECRMKSQSRGVSPR